MRAFVALALAPVVAFLLAGCGGSSPGGDRGPADAPDVADAGPDAPDAAPDLPDPADIPAGPDLPDGPDAPAGDAVDAIEDFACVAEVPPPLAPGDRSVMPCVRLRVSGTQPAGLWPLEARDAIATIRDSQPATGWKAPVGEPSWIEIDLQPWHGAPAQVESIRLGFEGRAPTGVTVSLMPSCGAAPTRIVAWHDPSMPLVLRDVAGCVGIDLVAPEALSVTALDLTSRDSTLLYPDDVPVEFPAPARAYADTGLIEGFYGVPWSWRERRNLTIELARNGMDTYLYAPKDDPLHRAQWRDAYPADFAEKFAYVASKSAQIGVRMAFGISPFLDWRADTGDDEILRAKCESFVDAGAKVVAILADDIEFAPGVTVDADLGALHVGVVNRLVTALAARDVAIWFTPTVYSDSRAKDWPGGQDYLDALAALDPSVRVLWTGPDTGNATMQASDLAAVTLAIGRAPLIWDNFWANDGGDGAFGRLFLAPYQGRAADLVAGTPPAVAGIAQNLSIQGALSRGSLATFGAWLDDPAGTDPGARTARGVAHEALYGVGPASFTSRDADLVRRVREMFDGFAQADPPHHAALDQAADAVASSLASGAFDPATVAGLLPVLGGMVALPSDVHHSRLDTDLVDELEFPLQKAVHEGRTGLLALDALADRLSGGDGKAALQAVDDESLLSAACRYLFSPDAVAGVVDAVRATPSTAGVVAPLVPAEAAPPACHLGRTLGWTPFPDASRVDVFGLPGATVDTGGKILWAPPHAGLFHAVVTAYRASPTPGWAHLETDVVCTDPCP